MNTELVFKFEDHPACFAKYDFMDKIITFYLGSHNKKNGERNEKEVRDSIMDDMNHELLHSVIIKQHGKNPVYGYERLEQEWLVFLMNGWKKWKKVTGYVQPMDYKTTTSVLKWIGILDDS